MPVLAHTRAIQRLKQPLVVAGDGANPENRVLCHDPRGLGLDFRLPLHGEAV